MRTHYAGVLILAVLPVAAQEPVRTEGPNLYSPEQERSLGLQLAKEIRQKTTPLTSPRVQEYMDHLGQRITPQLQGARFDYTFHVIANDPSATTHEPIALPGGVIFIPAALFLGANDEAEFAGMLAHSMEHVAQRHATRQATAFNRGSVAGILPLVFAGGWGSMSDQPIQLGWLRQMRSDELEADALAVEATARAGFDPAALVRYIGRARPAGPGALSKVFSRLPDRDQRIAALSGAIARLPKTSYTTPGPEFAAIREEVVRLTPPPAAEPRPRDRPTIKREK